MIAEVDEQGPLCFGVHEQDFYESLNNLRKTGMGEESLGASSQAFRNVFC